MATLPAERSNNPVAVIRQTLTQMAPEFKAALPSHVSEEKFRRVAMTAIQNAPDLIDADRRSLFGAIVRLAQDGLLPDGREAALVIFNTKNKSGGWDKKVQAMPMIAGVLKKIRQSGEVAKVSAQVVYENDHFVVKYGFDEDVEHVPPALDKPRGKVIGAYATAVLKDGSQLLEVMSLEEINRVRNVSKSKDRGPWVDWYSEMARKTVMRRLAKRLPMSSDLEEDVFKRDATMGGAPAPDLTVIDNAPAAPANRLDALESQIGEDEPEDAEVEEYDEDTGEVAAGSDGTLADDNPTAQEGPADEQRGESNNDADPSNLYLLTKAAIRKAKTVADVDAAMEAFDACDDMPEDHFSEVRRMAANKRGDLGGSDQ